RIQGEVRRNHGQVCERPFPALDLVFLGGGNLYQVADRGRQHVLVRFEIFIMPGKAAKRLRDVVRDRRLLGDDERLGHMSISKGAQCMRREKYRGWYSIFMLPV